MGTKKEGEKRGRHIFPFTPFDLSRLVATGRVLISEAQTDAYPVLPLYPSLFLHSLPLGSWPALEKRFVGR